MTATFRALAGTLILVSYSITSVTPRSFFVAFTPSKNTSNAVAITSTQFTSSLKTPYQTLEHTEYGAFWRVIHTRLGLQQPDASDGIALALKSLEIALSLIVPQVQPIVDRDPRLLDLGEQAHHGVAGRAIVLLEYGIGNGVVV